MAAIVQGTEQEFRKQTLEAINKQDIEKIIKLILADVKLPEGSGIAGIIELLKKNGKYSQLMPSIIFEMKRQASEQSMLVYSLAVCHQYGWGVELDLEKACSWYHAARNLKVADEALKSLIQYLTTAVGDAAAEYALGVCYLRGFGVPVNRKQALILNKQAADRGFIPAQKKLKDLRTSTGMFTKLRLVIEEEEVEFGSDEIVRIAQEVVAEQVPKPVYLPPVDVLDKFLDRIKECYDPTVLGTEESSIDAFLFAPAHVKDMRTPQEWLFVAEHFRNSSKQSAVVGWWLLVGGRIILIKNTKQHLFYASDHGFLSDVIPMTKEAVFDVPWAYNPQLALALVDIRKYFEECSENPAKDEKEKSDFFKLLSKSSFKELKKFHPGKTDAELRDMQSKISLDEQYQQEQWTQSKRVTEYVVDRVVKKFLQLKFKEMPQFDIDLIKKLGIEVPIAARMVKRIVLAELAREVNRGHAALLRPVHAYSTADLGAPYHEFASSIAKYLVSSDALTPQKLAKQFRNILIGQEIKSDALAFLQNLVVAWNVSEVARNPVAILTNPMQIDMLENGVSLYNENGVDLYSWQHTLVHPMNDQGRADDSLKAVYDLYGDKQFHPFEVGGSLPMAHAGSVGGSRKPLKEGERLDVVRQKEGSLMIHWLYLHIVAVGLPITIEILSHLEEPLDLIKKQSSIEDIEKRILRAEKDKWNRKIKTSKEYVAYAELQTAKENLLRKQRVIDELIKPLLRLRLQGYANYYPNVKNSNSAVFRIVNFFMGKEFYHFEKEMSNPNYNHLLDAIFFGIRHTGDKTFESRTDIQKRVSETLKTNKTQYFQQVRNIILLILDDILNDRVVKGISVGFLQLIYRELNALKQAYFKGTAEVDKAIDDFITGRGYDAYCANAATSQDIYRESEVILWCQVLKIRLDLYHRYYIATSKEILIKGEVNAGLGYYQCSYHIEGKVTVAILLEQEGCYRAIFPTKFGREAIEKYVSDYSKTKSVSEMGILERLQDSILSKLSVFKEHRVDYFTSRHQTVDRCVRYAAVGDLTELKHMLGIDETLIEAEDCRGSSLLMHAVNGRHVEVVEFLTKTKVNVNHVNQFGDSAIMMAAQHYHSLHTNKAICEERAYSLQLSDYTSIISILLRARADHTVKNKQGDSADSILLRYGVNKPAVSAQEEVQEAVEILICFRLSEEEFIGNIFKRLDQVRQSLIDPSGSIDSNSINAIVHLVISIDNFEKISLLTDQEFIGVLLHVRMKFKKLDNVILSKIIKDLKEIYQEKMCFQACATPMQQFVGLAIYQPSTVPVQMPPPSLGAEDPITTPKSAPSPQFSKAMSFMATTMNVSGLGLNCGLFALTLAIKLALKKNPVLKQHTRLPEFIDGIDVQHLQSSTPLTAGIGNKLRTELGTALTTDMSYQNRRKQGFLDYMRAHLFGEAPEEDMESFDTNREYSKKCKDEWMSQSKVIEEIYEEVQKKYNEQIKASVHAEKVEALSKALSNCVGEKVSASKLESIFTPYIESTAIPAYQYIQLRRLFWAAWKTVEMGTGIERSKLLVSINALFDRRVIAMAADNLFVENLLLMALVEETLFSKEGTQLSISTPKEINSKVRALYALIFVEKNWGIIYKNYCDYIGTQSVMITADELGCLSASWNVQLRIQFNNGMKPYETYYRREQALPHVTLCNPSREHWKVLCEDSEAPVPIESQMTEIVTLIEGIQNQNFKMRIIHAICDEQAYTRRQQDCTYVVAVLSAIQDTPVWLTQQQVLLSTQDNDAAKKLSGFFSSEVLWVTAETLYQFAAPLRRFLPKKPNNPLLFSSASLSKDQVMDVSGFGNNCGLFALTLGIKIAIKDNKKLQEKANIPAFVSEVDERALQTTTPNTAIVAKQLRAELETALLSDVQYKALRKNSFFDCMVNVLKDNHHSNRARPDMEAFITPNLTVVKALKQQWLGKEEGLGKKIEQTYNSAKELYYKYLENSFFPFGYVNNLYKELNDVVTNSSSDEIESINNKEISDIFDQFVDDKEAEPIYQYIYLKKLFEVAWQWCSAKTANERALLLEKINHFFEMRCMSIISLSTKKAKDLLLLSFVQSTNFIKGSIASEDVCGNAMTLFVSWFLRDQWKDIYTNYCQYVSASSVMLSADELGCLARYWTIQLTIQFNNGRIPYESYQHKNLDLINVTLCNPSHRHWMVVNKHDPKTTVETDPKILEDIKQIKNENLKSTIIQAICNEESYKQRKTDCSYVVAVVSSIQDTPIELKRRGIVLEQNDLQALEALSNYIGDYMWIKQDAEALYKLSDPLRKVVMPGGLSANLK